MGIVNSPLCKISEESHEHLFLHCPISSAFWFSVAKWLKIYFPSIHVLTGVNIMFGLFGEDKQLINHIVLLGKQVIFQSRHLNVNPSLPLLKAKLKNAYQLEVFIARQNDAMDTRNEKKNSNQFSFFFLCI